MSFFGIRIDTASSRVREIFRASRRSAEVAESTGCCTLCILRGRPREPTFRRATSIVLVLVGRSVVGDGKAQARILGVRLVDLNCRLWLLSKHTRAARWSRCSRHLRRQTSRYHKNPSSLILFAWPGCCLCAFWVRKSLRFG